MANNNQLHAGYYKPFTIQTYIVRTFIIQLNIV